MGYNTTITFNNDAYDAFFNNKEQVGEIVCRAIRSNCCKSYQIGNYWNYIDAQEPIHMDTQTIYVQFSGCLTRMDRFSSEFEQILSKNPDYVKKIVQFLEQETTRLKQHIKRHDEKLAEQKQEPENS